ncbi:hypothetical protein QJS04_geneDACA020942 [Acorus gramineus]|uniref:HAT C-terminal dimerisation domain-containing protein n=1 Tax=Acorus gramineus TaxID=55184 RepID=A0AAV9B642_ACOGR|nr:hypothetical protein QJS04_geneDACA020942 [Acorus gramineus]
MREGLSVYIASDEQPFTFAESRRFERFQKRYVNPQYRAVSRNTIRSDIIRVYNEMKNHLIQSFMNIQKISCTSDLWTGKNDLAYICVTSHYIDSHWMLNKRMLAFRPLTFPHTGTVIYQAIMDIFREYNITEKILSITFDNASNNVSAILKFKEFYDCKCVCHIINLIVQDGLTHIEESLVNIRLALKFITCTPSRVQAFGDFCATRNIPPRKFPLDMHVRWNSTYIMLQSPIDWQISKVFVQFLSIFYDASIACSGVYYPTSNLILRQLFNISCAFKEYRDYSILQQSIILMEQKFKKYFEDIPMLFCLAAVMDITIKLDTVKTIISRISDEMENFDLLQWWKAHEVTFPVLSIMARDLLTPPVSTVASESSFSTSGRILSERRTRLAASSLEALICLKDWSDADERDQEFVDSLEVDFTKFNIDDDQ